MNGQPIELALPARVRSPFPQPDHERRALVRRARLLAWLGVAWHVIEATIAILAGLAASSIALIGFGADSIVESGAGIVVIWRFAAARSFSENAERRAQQLISLSFFLLAAYIGLEAVHTLVSADRPDVSRVGIGLSVLTLLTMPLLAAAKARIGERLDSAATRSEGRQNLVCAYLSAGLLVGLGSNALFGFWWADPVAAILIALVAVKEGRNAWAGGDCCTSVPGITPDGERECCN